MGVLSSTVSLSRFRVKGKFDDAPIETVEAGLNKFKIQDIDKEPSDIAVGWTSLETPYSPDFSGSSFLIGNYFVFSLRIDKKTVPTKILKQHYAIEEAKKLAETDREFLSKNEKTQLMENLKSVLLLRIPPTPNIFDIIWDYENSTLSFFSTQNAANEELESLFLKSFNISLIKLFPYTIADLECDLSDTEKDKLSNLKPTLFTE